jgi:hypothetical protein
MHRAFIAALLLLPVDRAARAQEAAPAAIQIASAQPDEGMNQKFAGTDGWIGSDGVTSIPLPDDSTLWIFGDTLAGKIRGGKRHDLTMVNNSFARQRGWGPGASVELLLNTDARGKPTSFVAPASKQGYYWLWDGIVEQGALYLFATRLTSPGTITAFDWKLMDQALIVVSNPCDPPGQWKIRQLDLPFGVFTEQHEILWGLEVLEIDNFTYVYGTSQAGKGSPRSLLAARAPAGSLARFDRWTFYDRGAWREEERQAAALTTGVGTEGSVTWLPERGKYVYVYSPPLDPRIMMRTANTPEGPWSEPITIYTCPEAAWDSRIFCYAGKARLVPGTRDELLVSYATNSFEMLEHVTADARIYFPRFVRVRLAD